MRVATLWWMLGLAGVVGVVALSLMPRPPVVPGDREGWLSHLLAYGALMGWFCQLLPAERGRILMAAALLALGIGIEYAQRATGYRTFDVMDIFADGAGIALGWLASPPRVPHVIGAFDRAFARHFGPGKEGPS